MEGSGMLSNYRFEGKLAIKHFTITRLQTAVRLG